MYQEAHTLYLKHNFYVVCMQQQFIFMKSVYLSALKTGSLQMTVVSHLVEEGGVQSGYVVVLD